MPLESHAERHLCSTLTRKACERDSGRCGCSLVKLTNDNPHPLPEEWLGEGVQSHRKSLSSVFLLSLDFSRKSLFSHFSFTNLVESELFLLQSSMKPQAGTHVSDSPRRTQPSRGQPGVTCLLKSGDGPSTTLTTALGLYEGCYWH